MTFTELNPRIIRSPALEGHWLNVARSAGPPRPRPKQVMLIDFWDYTCLNCLRTLPYLMAWHERYAGHGLLIIGVHSPEFTMSGAAGHVREAIEALGLPYPVLVDSDHRLWDAFAVKAWPTKFVVDPDGYVRLSTQGEGRYGPVERAIQQLLRLEQPDLELPTPIESLRDEDRPGAVCYRPTAEIYMGYDRGAFWHGALGNPEGYHPGVRFHYIIPPAGERAEGMFYLSGVWQTGPNEIVPGGAGECRVLIDYRGATVNAVLSPEAEGRTATEHGTDGDRVVEIRQDGRPLESGKRGDDVALLEDGRTVVSVSRPRLYQLIRNNAHQPHEMELIFSAHGPALYTVTFSACVVDETATTASAETFVVH